MCASPSSLSIRREWLPLVAGSIVVLFASSLIAYIIVDSPAVAVDPKITIFALPGGVVVVNPPEVATDPAFYQHVGWYVTRGGIPYIDVWDINPPLTFAVAAVLSIIAGGNLPLQHTLGVLLTFATVGAAVVLTAWLAYDLTGENAAAIAAAFVLLVPAEVYGLVPYGLRSQYFALLFGVLALIFVRRDRQFASGASAAAAAGFWQPGGGIMILVMGMAAQRNGRTGILRTVGGGIIVTALVALPFLAIGAFVPMVAQTVLAPFYGQAPYTLIGRTYSLALAMGYGTMLLPVAVAGWVLSAMDLGKRWWIPAGAILYTLQIYFVNFNGSLDALLFLVFVALGTAITVAILPKDRRRLVVTALIIIVLTGPIWHLAPAAPPRESIQTQYEGATQNTNPALEGVESSVPNMQTIYWEKIKPDTCHYRLSHTELRWIANTDARLNERRCGHLPEWSG